MLNESSFTNYPEMKLNVYNESLIASNIFTVDTHIRNRRPIFIFKQRELIDLFIHFLRFIKYFQVI